MRTTGPAVLSSALVARKGVAVPTGYASVRPVRLSVAARTPATPPDDRARISVRLDRDLHLRLKLSAAHLDRSLQDVVTEALERHLEQLSPEILRSACPCLGIDKSAGAAKRRAD